MPLTVSQLHVQLWGGRMGRWTASSALNHLARSQKSKCQALGPANIDVQPVRLPRAICVHKLVQPVTCFTFRNPNNHKHRHFLALAAAAELTRVGWSRSLWEAGSLVAALFFSGCFSALQDFFGSRVNWCVAHPARGGCSP